MEYIKVGIIINTFGIKGEVKVQSLTDFPDDRFKVGNRVFVHYQKQYEEKKIASYRNHKGFVLLQFVGNENINDVEKYKDCIVYVNKDEVKTLNKGSYYYFQLQGCNVYCDNQCIGQVESVESGYQTILRVKHENKEVLIPYVNAFIKDVNIDNKRIDVKVIEGML